MGKPLVLILDDAQFMPPFSWGVCRQIAIEHGEAPLLLVIGCRASIFTSALDHSKVQSTAHDFAADLNSTTDPFPLQTTRSEFRKKARAMFLDLAVFVQVDAIIRQDRGVGKEHRIAMNLVGFLKEKTAGNPLFITKALSFLESLELISFEGQELTVKGAFNEVLPPSVESTCGMMLDELTKVQLLMLKTASLCDDTFSLVSIQGLFPVRELVEQCPEN